jgi:hypothetical protein
MLLRGGFADATQGSTTNLRLAAPDCFAAKRRLAGRQRVAPVNRCQRGWVVLAKVFCLFFSKKKCFLLAYTPAAESNPSTMRR